MSEYIARISYGKDSLKMLDVIHSRGLPLDRITTTDVWATDTTSANLPPMEEFKARMDERIWQMYRIEVEHLCARNKDGSKKTYEQMFYHIPVRRSQIGNVERETVPGRQSVGLSGSLESLVSSMSEKGYHPPMAGTGRNHRIPAEHRVQLVPEAQASSGHPSRDSRWQQESHTARSSNQGFPAQISPWCRKLKIYKVATPFQKAPPRGAGKEISWNTLESRLTSRSVSVS